MAIKYSLVKNGLKGQEEKYMARIRSVGQRDLDDIVDEIAFGGSTVTKADAQAVLHLFFDLVNDSLLKGYTVSTPLFNVELKIRGNFKGEQDRFWPKRHKVEAAITSGQLLKQNMRRVKLQKAEARSKEPVITQFKYLDPELPTGALQPGGIVVLEGFYLKLDPKDPEQQVVLRKGREELLQARVLTSKGRELIVQLPNDIPQGSYQLEVHAKPGSARIVRKAVWRKMEVAG